MGASDLFHTAFESKFSVSDSANYIIEGYSDQVVHAMIRHIYGFDFDDERRAEDEEARVEFYIDVYLIANEYFIESLKEAVTNTVYHWMYDLYEQESGGLNVMLESIISLYNTYTLFQPDRKNKISLHKTAAQFCIKYRPTYVVKICSRPGETYKSFVLEMIDSRWQSVHLRYPGCEDNRHCTPEYGDHYPTVDRGDWSDGFIDFFDTFDEEKYDIYDTDEDVMTAAKVKAKAKAKAEADDEDRASIEMRDDGNDTAASSTISRGC